MADINEINDLVGNRDFHEAKKLIEIALKETANDKQLLKLAGLTYVNLELWREAKKQFESVVKLENDDATSWFYLAKCYEKLADFISAKNAYVMVLNLRNEYMEAYKALSMLLLKMNEPLETIKVAEKAKTIENDSIFDFIIGTAYMKNKEFEKRVKEISAGVVSELFRILWQRRAFYDDIKR